VRWMMPPAPVYAACQAANSGCIGPGAATKTAVVDAAYVIPGGSFVTPVEPTAATSWSIVAYWGRAPGGNCTDYTQTATVDVSWNGTNWVTANFAATADILQVGVCTLVSCTSSATHSSSYRLYVDINDPELTTGTSANLRQVVFTATTVPNGTDFDSSTCTTGSARTPTASSFAGTDSGPFECPFSCSATGATVTLTYQ
jgi:hypothetical protein